MVALSLSRSEGTQLRLFANDAARNREPHDPGWVDRHQNPQPRRYGAGTAKPSAVRKPTALPRSPHTCCVLGQHSLGCRTSGEAVGAFTFVLILPLKEGRPKKNNAIKPAWLCFPSNAYCEKKTVRGNKLPRSDLCEHLGNEGCLLPWITQNRTTSSPCCRAWKTLEGWRTRLAATPLMTYMSPPSPTLSGRVSSGKCFGDFGLTVRHHVKARPPCLITNY